MHQDQRPAVPDSPNGTSNAGFPPPVGDQPAPPREMGQFASLALAMSTICILAGGITSFPQGLCSVGGAAIGIGWPLGLLFALCVALTMGQVVSAFPRAGGPCEWASELGGIGWGWVAGCFNLAALISALAAVNVGLCRFIISCPARDLVYDPESLSPWVLHSAVILTTLAQAFINHRGLRLTTMLTNFSGYLIVVVAAALTVLLVLYAMIAGNGLFPGRLIEFTNFSGPAGGSVWPETSNLAWLFGLGLLLPAYTFTGYDASAQTAEETRDPEINIPKAIWQAVLVSGLVGWVLLSVVVIAAPDLNAAAGKGADAFVFILRDATPYWSHAAIYVGLCLAQFFCGLAVVTSASRLAWAMARDAGLPGARYVRRIGSHQTPSIAIWTVSAVATLAAVVLLYDTVAAVCAVFFYIAYIIPTVCGLLTFGRWPRLGPWQLGRWYPPLAVVCVLGCVALLVLAVQPPNQIALLVVPAMMVGLFALWFGYYRLYFRDEVTRALRKLPAFRDFQEVKVTPLGGGLTNRNFRIEIAGQTYVLRFAGAGAEALLIDRPRELIAARAAAAAGVAPDVVDHLDDHTVLVTRFIPGKPITADDTQQKEVMRRVTGALRAFHDHPVPDTLGKFSAFETVRYYQSRAREKNVPLPADLDQAMGLLSRIEDAVRADDPHCLCHNDLLLGNFIDAGHTLLIIDWEYAGLGDRFFDLGNFAAHNQLSEAGERLLLECYFGEAKPEDLRRLRLMRLVSDLREATWGYLQSAISPLYTPQHYLDHGRRFLDRFLSAPLASELSTPPTASPTSVS